MAEGNDLAAVTVCESDVGSVTTDGVPRSAVQVAGVVVAVTGVLVRAPLAKVPENALKFAVGIMLTSFGIFWGAEGAGVDWPGDEVSLLAVIAFFGLVSFALVRALRRKRTVLVSVGAEA